ncbi:MAG: GNAT family N-acetyltransferase [Gammaproteobacteria bacterium]|nr:GNAT family N-acetyltransferase [Gammaproteobacteria bacterium]MDH5650688.1 GNAT family N-acetyltransferase [Gammaproteobacteria bacterium]
MAELRPMYMSDLNTVVKIIEATDEDDAEEAREIYQEYGVEGQFVLEHDNKIIGVIGYSEVPGTDGTYWLSWTYLDPAFQGLGMGKQMLNDLLNMLREKNGRKIFVKVSDYDDPEDGRVYERAMKLYESVGFVEELVGKDFYDEGENQHIYGLKLRDAASDEEDEVEIADEKPVIRFDGMYEIGDSDGAYTFSWTVKDNKGLFEKRNFTVEDLRLGIDAVRNEGGRKIFLTFPSNLPLIHTPLQAAGFKFVGRLTDYYEKGVHELHFTHDLGNG